VEDGIVKFAAIQSMAAATACLGMLISPAALAAPPGQAGAVIDVALGEGGALAGQVVDAQGAPLAGTVVSLRSGGRQMLQATTDARGAFEMEGVKGGVYEVTAGGHHGVYRLWAPRTAPPAANRGIMAVSGDAVRGQYDPPPIPGEPIAPGSALGPAGPPSGYVETVPYVPGDSGPVAKSVKWVRNHPWISAGIVATAIAVPVAVTAADDDSAS
jgi:hypothetical protein